MWRCFSSAESRSGFRCFGWAQAETFTLLAAFLVGLGMGAEADIIAYLTSRYFGLRSFGEIYGYLFATFTLAGALGPVLMGVGFDHLGSYRAPLLFFLAATLVATALLTRLGPYVYRPMHQSSRSGVPSGRPGKIPAFEQFRRCTNPWNRGGRKLESPS